MSSKPIRDVVLISTGMASEVIAAYLDRFSEFNLVGFTVDRDYMKETEYLGKPVAPWDEIQTAFPPDQVLLMGPPTFARLNTFRRDRYNEGKAMGYGFASFIHPSSNVMTDDIGDHVIILDGCVVLPKTKIGNNVIIWCDTHVGHHCVIADHVFMSAQVGIAGNSKVGAECFLGGQAGIAHGVTIGDRCAIVNAAKIGNDVADDSVLAGYAAELKPFPSSRMKRLL